MFSCIFVCVWCVCVCDFVCLRSLFERCSPAKFKDAVPPVTNNATREAYADPNVELAGDYMSLALPLSPPGDSDRFGLSAMVL